MDADKEGFLRNERSLTQTAGRAARNSNGRVILYADRLTPSMQKMMDETNRRRSIQIAYNEKNSIVPTTVFKSREEIMKQSSVLEIKGGKIQYEEDDNKITVAADPVVQYMSKEQLKKAVEEAKRLMKKAAKDTDFMSAAQYRDEMFALKNILKEKFGEED